MDLREELSAATKIAREAGSIALSYFQTNRIESRAKGDRDVVTAADFASEAHIQQRLQELFPADGFIGEEGDEVSGRSGRRWCVDPVDGTVNFSREIPIWCVSIALFMADSPVLGVIHDPVRDETFTAVAGEGAHLNEKRITTRLGASLDSAIVHLTIDFEDPASRVGLDDVNTVAPRVLRTRNIGSAALSLAYVAAGRFDAVLHRDAHSWDYAAGVVIVREARGSVTAIDGSEYLLATTAVAAGASHTLRESLVELVRRPGSARIQ
jgi:myo-inositol-1(or 4)-monophosphatase